MGQSQTIRIFFVVLADFDLANIGGPVQNLEIIRTTNIGQIKIGQYDKENPYCLTLSHIGRVVLSVSQRLFSFYYINTQ
jgi:hypothetical protein